MEKTTEISNIFKPTANQMRYLEMYVSQEVKTPVETLCEMAGITAKTYYEWRKNPAFNKWFYDQIQVQKHRHLPDILMNAIRRAKDPKASPSDIELAMRILDAYTPTTRTETLDITDKKINEVLERAKELIES